MIDDKKLKALEKSYEKNQVAKALTRVLVNTTLRDIAENQTFVQNDSFNFSVEVKTQEPVNQKNSGRCWIFSGLNFLREHAAKALNAKEFEFSQNYVAFYDHLEKINFFLDSMDNFLDCHFDDRTFAFLLNRGIEDGGQWQMFRNVVEKYGLVPKSAMPETGNSGNTGLLNSLINKSLRIYVAKARKLHAEGKDHLSLKEKTLENLYVFLAATLGVPPKKFVFDFKDKDDKFVNFGEFTPLSFFKKVITINLDDYVSIINSPSSDKPFYERYEIEYLASTIEGNKVTHLNVPMAEMKEAIIKQLESGETVWFGSDVSFDGRSKDGIYDDRRYNYEELFGLDLTLDKGDGLLYLASAMNHAMTIVGVNLVNGKPTKWKIQNSWGTDIGAKGFFLASDSWFEKYTYQALVKKEYLSKEAQEAAGKKPRVVKPWDPMGTLAK